MSVARRNRPPQALAIAVVLAAVLAGCGGSSRAAPGKATPTITFDVQPTATSNRGRPLHAIVRAVTLKQFAEDQYRTIADLVVNPDDTVLAAFVVFPGVKQRVTIDKPTKGATAVYFLFTGATGTSWKQLYESPPASIRLSPADDALAPASTSPSSKPKAKPKAKAKR